MNKVELLGYYGSDFEHAMSAWTSTKRELTDEKRARIPALLKQLADNGHETPFEKSSLHFLVDCEVASHIHLLKHRIGVSINGESARYKQLTPRRHLPSDWPDELAARLEMHTLYGEELYREAVGELESLGFSRKRAKESARYFLGYANVTSMDVMFNFRSFVHFQRLRNDEHAQLEVREIATEMLKQVMALGVFEHSIAAFKLGDKR